MLKLLELEICFDHKKASESDQEMPQSQIADQPTHHEEETQNTDSHDTIKVKQPALSSSAR